ncbi:MAG: c-type cytochrome, partial [Gemmatimonadetes bacterium]|nr:c-type cytochrome [Gemmatimonadota bacterium]
MSDSMTRFTLAAALATILMSPAVPVRAQIPVEFRNLRVLPRDISRDSLVQVMRSFSFATGLRCEDCHVLPENGAFENAQFDLDDKLTKRRARYMLEMVNRLNEELRIGLPERDQPALSVECKTCHRGLRKLFLLRTELRDVLANAGVDSAVSRYRELRLRASMRGVYDFGEWEMNELAREVAQAGNTVAAIAFLEL